MNKTDKTQAIITLLEFSLLFTLEQKTKLVEKLPTLSDEEIDAIGKILAAEHRNRDQLDAKMAEDFINAFNKDM